MSPPRNRPHFTTECQHDAYDDGWAAGRATYQAALADAFRAGAEYVLRAARPPYGCIVLPDEIQIGDAAKSYVSALDETGARQ